jgi:hypothetical protein
MRANKRDAYHVLAIAISLMVFYHLISWAKQLSNSSFCQKQEKSLAGDEDQKALSKEEQNPQWPLD